MMGICQLHRDEIKQFFFKRWWDWFFHTCLVRHAFWKGGFWMHYILDESKWTQCLFLFYWRDVSLNFWVRKVVKQPTWLQASPTVQSGDGERAHPLVMWFEDFSPNLSADPSPLKLSWTQNQHLPISLHALLIRELVTVRLCRCDKGLKIHKPIEDGLIKGLQEIGYQHLCRDGLCTCFHLH